MITQPYRLYVERTDRRQNMARFYALAIERTLFGEICLVRRWGRIGTQGQELAHYFENERDAVLLFLDLTRRKRHRGYSPIKTPGLSDDDSRKGRLFASPPARRSARSRANVPDTLPLSFR